MLLSQRWIDYTAFVDVALLYINFDEVTFEQRFWMTIYQMYKSWASQVISKEPCHNKFLLLLNLCGLFRCCNISVFKWKRWFGLVISNVYKPCNILQNSGVHFPANNLWSEALPYPQSLTVNRNQSIASHSNPTSVKSEKSRCPPCWARFHREFCKK